MWLEIWDSKKLASGPALAPSLTDLLQCYDSDPGYTWRLFEHWGEAKGLVLGRTLDELEKAAAREQGLELSWNGLQELARSSLTPYDMTLAGFDRSDIVPRSLKDEDLECSSRAVIQLVDSTSWRFYETNQAVLGEIRRRFRDVRVPS